MLKNNLSKILGEQRIKLSELEKISGVSRSTLTRLYHDRASGINFDTIERLCKVLDCTVSDILEYIPD